ncbi:MAG: hypothetical protein HZA53_09040 [Planctomycetes bacterium]|nr:hypothetical protein [Planctomycetota bacterium]
MKHSMKLLPALALLALTACISNDWGHRPQSANPDKRLADLMESYEHAKSHHDQGDGTSHILVDAERVKNEVERLAIEFPRHVPTLMANAVLAFDHAEYQKCQSYCDRLFSIEPIHADAAVLRSQVAIREGDLPFAKRLLETQKSYTPDHARVREALSATYYLMKDYDAAGRELAAAEQLGAAPWRVAYNRGLIAEAKGDPKGAIAAYEVALATNPDFAPARSRLAGRKAEGGVQ